MSKPGNLWRKIHGKITKRPTNFSWLIDETLAGCGMPTTNDEIKWLQEMGVKSIVTMTENSLPESWVANISYLHVPTEDLTAPDLETIDHTVDFVRERIQENEPVMVHCAAGIGRTGTILACYLIKFEKYTAKKAIEKVRKERPGSIQSESQEIAVSYYEKFLKN